MHLVQDILHKYLDEFVIVFIDDILMFAHTTEEHIETLKLIFQRLNKQHIYTKASKCLLHVIKLEFLGQWIMTKGVTLTQAKLKVVCEWEIQPTSKVQSFLGFANHCQRFVHNSASIASY